MNTKTYALLQFSLMAAFAARVAGQMLSLYFPNAVLPPFEAWHSGVMPYWLLVCFQIAILGLMWRTSLRAWQNRLDARPATTRMLWWFGAAYLAAMSVRLLLGQTLLADHRWFSNVLSTSFHFVLAAFVLITAVVLKNKNPIQGVRHV